MNCGICHKILGPMTFQEELEAHQEYRQNFPETYDNASPAVKVCDDCYQKLIRIKPPQEWERDHLGGAYED